MIYIFFCLFFLSPSLALPQEPAPERELRAAWIATVFNIDWPSKPSLDSESQKKELLSILDSLASLNFNTLMVQVKPASDAFYESRLSPWSRYLTGTQGLHPGYDPLTFLIEESRKRGLEVHAWINPFRVLSGEKLESLAPSHIARKKPEWLIEYGGRFYFNPGIPEVRAYVQNEIIEIVRNYDIDAIHMDDYFYPYKVGGLPFPDGGSFEKYGQGKTLEDWRRSNTEIFVQGAAAAIKKEKKHVRFGISPFGVWRNKSADPKGSDSKAGQTNYDDLYADILAWVEKGYIDYLIPQLYWDFNQTNAPFGVLADWWSKAVGGKVQLQLGLGAYRLGEGWDAGTLSRQIDYLRRDKNISGAAFYSAKWIHNDTKGIKKSLAQAFAQPAIPPAFDGEAPAPPAPYIKNNSLEWKPVPKAWNYAVYGAEAGGKERLLALLPGVLRYPIKENWVYRVSSLSRSHAESPKASLAYEEKEKTAAEGKPAVKPLPPKDVMTVEKPIKPSAVKPFVEEPEKPSAPARLIEEGKPRVELIQDRLWDPPKVEPAPQIKQAKIKVPSLEEEAKPKGLPQKAQKPQKPSAPIKPNTEKQGGSDTAKDFEEIFNILKERAAQEAHLEKAP